MRNQWSEDIKNKLRPLLSGLFSKGKKYKCPICGYCGIFKDKRISKSPLKIRKDSKCLKCGSCERHRLMYLTIKKLAETEDFSDKKILHIAPEKCLKDQLKGIFAQVDTADLFMEGVDYKEDLQKLSFPDASYDWVIESRVLTVPPDLNACLDEMRRVVRPGGGVIIAETYTHNDNVEHGKMIKFRSRVIGLQLIDMLAKRFSTVKKYSSDDFDPDYQLLNMIEVEGKPFDDFPEDVRANGLGYKDVIVVCRV